MYKKCPQCGSDLVLKEGHSAAGKYYKFWGCSGFPDCRFILKNNFANKGRKVQNSDGGDDLRAVKDEMLSRLLTAVSSIYHLVNNINEKVNIIYDKLLPEERYISKSEGKKRRIRAA